MRITRFIILLLLLVIGFCLESCKGDDSRPTPQELLETKNGWKLTAMTLSLTNSPNDNQDLYSTLDDCTKDNIVKFLASGIYIEDEGPTKCDPDDPQTADTASWTFSSTKTTQSVTMNGLDQFGGVSVTFDITMLTPKQLVMSWDGTTLLGSTPTKITVTYEAL
jgi:hypothetical protein